MEFAAPLFLVVGVVGGGAVVAIHFLARSRPPRRVFPTTRFVPQTHTSAAAVARTPTDWLLLSLRLGAVLAVALAMAMPAFAGRASTLRIIAVLGWRAAASEDLVQGARGVWREGDLFLVVRDSLRLAADIAEIDDGAPPTGRSTVSTALLGALEIARARRNDADSVALFLVMPLVQDVWDAATPQVRRAWEGAVSIVAVQPSERTPVQIDVGADLTSEVRSGLALLANTDPGAATVRMRALAPAATDTAWVRDHRGVYVHWPSLPSGSGVDTASGVAAGGIAFVESLTRWSLPEGGRSVVHYVDGHPAVAEHSLGEGCVREVGFAMPTDGDAVLRPAALGIVQHIVAPCGGWPDLRSLSPAQLAELEGDTHLLAAGSLPSQVDTRVPATPLLLFTALLLLGIEQLARRRLQS